MDPSDGFEVIAYVPCPSLPYNQPGELLHQVNPLPCSNQIFSGVAYACVTIPDEDPTEVTTTLSCTMKFTVKDCDPVSGEADDDGYEDEYVVSCRLFNAGLVH